MLSGVPVPMDIPLPATKTSGQEGSAQRDAESWGGEGLLASVRAQRARCGPLLPTPTLTWPHLCTSPWICHPLLASPWQPLISDSLLWI